MNPILAGESARGNLTQIEATSAELRRTIAPVLEAVAGVSPRPTRVSRAIGLDKSLASRLVRAMLSSSRAVASIITRTCMTVQHGCWPL